MSYFTNVPTAPYSFGSQELPVNFQNITAYVEVVDRIKSNLAFYENYYILDGDRPDQLSSKLYGTTDYYFMFYMMNDHIRERGWPLSEQRLVEKVKIDYPNTVLTTTSDMSPNSAGVAFGLPGTTVTGSGTGSVGTVIKRNLDLGQLVISTNDTFSNTEVIVGTPATTVVILTGSTKEYQSIAYFKEGSGRRVDIDPYSSPNVSYTPVTWEDEYRSVNNSLRQIKVPRAAIVSDIANIYYEAMTNV